MTNPKQKVYKSAMDTGKTLEYNPGNGIRINPSPTSNPGGQRPLGIYMTTEDLLDLAASIQKEHAAKPAVPKVDERFTVGSFAKRKHPIEYGDLGDRQGHNGPLKVVGVREYTADERRYRFTAVPADSVRVSYVTEMGFESQIASFWLEPVEVDVQQTEKWLIKS